MNGFRVLLRKELAEAWQTRRLPVVAGLFAVIGMLSPLTARYLPEILQAALGDQLPVALPTPTAVDAVEQLQKNLAQLGALAAIALAMGSVSGELDRGTAALVLAQPVTRPAFLAAKLLGDRRRARDRDPARRAGGLRLHRGPVRGPADRRLARDGRPSWLALTAWAALTFARVGGDRVHDGRRRDRVRRPHRTLARRDRAGRSTACCRPA